MLKYISVLLLGLICTGHNNSVTNPDPVCEKKKQKRRIQNVKAAKKSYEAKKKEREALLQKNTQLVEDQLKLLHDKNRLLEQVATLEHIYESIRHSFTTCPPSRNPNGVHRSEVCFRNRTVTPKPNFFRDDNEALDLSISKQVVTPAAPRPKMNKSCHDSAGLSVQRNSRRSSCILDESSLELGATLEVGFTCEPRRKAKHDKIIQDDYAPIPSLEKRIKYEIKV